MNKVFFIIAISLIALSGFLLLKPKENSQTQLALLCFKTGEQISGLNKICFYNCAGSGAAITIRNTSLCPLTINS